MGRLLDDGGGALTAIVLTVFGALLLLGALGAFLIWRRRSEDMPTGALGRNARLVVSGTAIVDGRRRLVLVRRDDVEHLLLIGGPSDIVVESNITRQSTAGLASVPRRAVARQNEPQQATRPAAAVVSSPAPPERGPWAEADGAAQERLSAAGAALPRQAAPQPGRASQPAERKDQAEAPYQASSAVAGLAAGLAALTAAAGSRARTEAPNGDGTSARRAGSVPAEALNRNNVGAEPASPDRGDEDRPTGVSKTATVQAAPAAPVGGSEAIHAGGGHAAESPAGPVGAQSSTCDQGQTAPDPLTTGAIGARKESVPLPQTAEPGNFKSHPVKQKAEPERPAGDGVPERDTDADGAGEPAAMASARPAASERAALVVDEAPKNEAALVRAAGERAPPVQPAASGRELTLRRNEPANSVGGESGGKSEHTGAQPLSASKAEGNSQEVVPSGSSDVRRLDRAAAGLSEFRPSRGATLGDLAGRLDEVLIRKAASGPDPDLRVAMPVGPETMSPKAAPPEHDEPSRVGLSAGQRPAPPPGQRPQATIAETDEAAVIDFAGHRRTSGDSLEEEMARLLGELTRDAGRR